MGLLYDNWFKQKGCSAKEDEEGCGEEGQKVGPEATASILIDVKTL